MPPLPKGVEMAAIVVLFMYVFLLFMMGSFLRFLFG